jgi:hypothetical protein
MIAFVSAFAVPGIIRWRAAAKLRTAAESLKGDLEFAKVKAIQENGPVAIYFQKDGYQIYLDITTDTRLLKNVFLPIEVSFTSKTFGADADAWPRKTRFMGRGTAGNGTAYLTGPKGTEPRKVVVSNLGRIRIEKVE